ncbi:hypothetical protein RclHR1_10680011 [Rhizophagus clarus]|uniref:Uncharacterized protein n=1 Tax=Rhizophagus clarus TaxID=94130 RepID=A0A2Z6Q2I6_9GLOM|nr:hypothetical protein RclHR1_10680011 [Rhizophagus clarus]
MIYHYNIKYPAAQLFIDPLAETAKHDSLNETRYPIASQASLITHHESYNQEIPSPFDAIDVDQSSTRSISTFVNLNTPTNKSTDRWTSSETRILIALRKKNVRKISTKCLEIVQVLQKLL